LARVQALIGGLQQHFPSGSFTLGNAAFTTASLVQELQSLVDAMQKTDAAEASAKDLRAALHTREVQVRPIITDLQHFVRATFANATQALADFGMQAQKAHKPLTSEKRAVATARLRATRKVRGTTSKKQKLAVKGDVTGVLVIPVTESATASPTQPASNAPAAPIGPANAPPK
jgi:hypothetical protein